MIKIIEPIKDNENEIQNVFATSEVPLSIYLYGKRTDDEYQRIMREHLQIQTQTIFDHIALLASVEDGYQQDFKVYDFREIIQTLSHIGKALIKAQTDDFLKVESYPKQRLTETEKA